MGVGVGVGGYTGSEHNKNLKPLVVAQFCVHSYRHSDAHRHSHRHSDAHRLSHRHNDAHRHSHRHSDAHTHIGSDAHRHCTHMGTVTHTDTVLT